MSQQASDSTMRAVVHHKYGKFAEVLEVQDVPQPKPGPNQVKVAVKAAAINPVDWKIVEGHLANFFPKTFPHIPGFDVSGVVVEVGANVKDFQVGDEVYADTGNTEVGGTFAQYCVIEESHVAKKPQRLSFAEAASVPLACLTSFQALVKAAVIQEGDDEKQPQQQQQQQQQQQKLLVLGGSGGCGMFGVMLGKAYGAYVASTCGSSNVERLNKYGCDQVIDYSKQKWYEVLQGASFDVVYDTVGEQDSYEHATKVLREGGVFVSIASRGQADSKYRREFVMTNAAKGKQQLAHIANLIDSGKVSTEVEKVFNLNKEEVCELFTHSQSSRAKGKLVLLLDQNSK